MTVLLIFLFLVALIVWLAWMPSGPRASYETETATVPPPAEGLRAVNVLTHYYVPGKLQAKYWAESAGNYAATAKEQTREIHISEAEVFADYEHIAGSDNQRRLKELFETQRAEFISPLPDPLPTTITRDEVAGRYQLKFSATKVFDFALTDIQHEGKESFGTIHGKFIGRINKVTTTWEPEEPPPLTNVPLKDLAGGPGGISQLKSFGRTLYERTRIVTSAGKSWSGWKVSGANMQPTGCRGILFYMIYIAVLIFFALVFLGLLAAIVRTLVR